jgi:hypothetical protein
MRCQSKGQIDRKSPVTGCQASWALLGALSLLIAGCGSTDTQPAIYPATGKIRFNGAAPVGAVVALHAKSQPMLPGGHEVVPSGLVKADGSFDLTSFAPFDGAPPGDYVLTVEWHKTSTGSDENRVLGPNALPGKYSKPSTSPLAVTIATQPNELKPIVLK